MISPTRTALYLAIGALSFAANEAAALVCKVGVQKCTTTGGYRSCYCPNGSEVGSVTVTQFDGEEGSIFRATWDISNYYQDELEIPRYCKQEGRPPGREVCAPAGVPALPPFDGPLLIPDPCAEGQDNGGIYGVNAVTMAGGASAGALSEFDPMVVCSQQKIALSGHSTIIGDVEAPDTASMVKTTGGSAIIGGIFDEDFDTPDPVSACGPFGPAPIFANAKGSFNATSGALKVQSGGFASLDAAAYCFSSISLSSGATLTIADRSGPDDTTINVTGKFSNNGTILTGGAKLTINSSGNQVSFSGQGGGDHLIVYAPNADISFAGQGTYSGAFTGKTVALSGGATINSTNASDEDCSGDFCTATAIKDCATNPLSCELLGDIKVPPGETCDPGGGALLDFTADTFIGHVVIQQCAPGEEGFDCVESDTEIYQLCNRVGNEYDCSTRLQDVGSGCFEIYEID